jgi:predicted transcriptional regulator
VDIDGILILDVGVEVGIAVVERDGMLLVEVGCCVKVGKIFIVEVLVELHINSIYAIIEYLFWYWKRTPISGLPSSLLMFVEALARNEAQVTSSNVMVSRVT